MFATSPPILMCLDAEGTRFTEGTFINKSLLTLGTVITKLAENAPHIPFRDSKLTRILESSLGGNSRTAMICTISPSERFREETKSTLTFASRAKQIKNKPQVNEVMDDRTMLQMYKKEIARMKKHLAEMSAELELANLRDENERLLADYANADEQRRALKAKLEKTKRIFLGGAAVQKSANKKPKELRRQTWAPSTSASFLPNRCTLTF